MQGWKWADKSILQGQISQDAGKYQYAETENIRAEFEDIEVGEWAKDYEAWKSSTIVELSINEQKEIDWNIIIW